MHAPVHRWWIWLSLWIRGLEKFCVSSTTMVIKTELWTRVHSPVIRAADCRSAGPWFYSGWRHWIHIHWHVQRNNIISPTTTTMTMPITTIPRKSVNKKGEGKGKRGRKGRGEGEKGGRRKGRGGGERGFGRNGKAKITLSSTDWSTRSETGATSLVKDQGQFRFLLDVFKLCSRLKER